jgi:6-methylsalicylate decarboxylase
VAHRIDVHAHAFPEWHLRAAARAYPDAVQLCTGRGGKLIGVWSGAPIPAWDAKLRLAEMDRDGVATEVLCAPLLYAQLDENTAPLCRDLNDFQAALAQDHPGRFRSYLHVPVHQIDEALRELERWHSHRAVAGVVLGSNLGGAYPGDPSFSPIWQAIDRLGYAVFIHPIKPAACFGPAAPPLVMFPCDTALCAASIIYNGIFERFGDIRVLLSHYGGVLPLVCRRLDMGLEVAGFPPGHGQNLPAPPSTYVSRFYVDTAQGYYRPAFDCAAAVYGLDRILYGSDHFFANSTWRPELNAFFAKLDLPDADLRMIEYGNARRVLEPAFRPEV